MARRAKLPMSCRMGRHRETYASSLTVVDFEVRRCTVCHVIPDLGQAEISVIEEQALLDFQEIRPLRERLRRVRDVVEGAMTARGYPIPNKVS